MEPNTITPVKSDWHNHRVTKLLLVALAAVLVVGLGWYVWFQNTSYVDNTDYSAPSVVDKATKATEVEETTPAIDLTADWKVYTNSELGISFKYPASWLTPTSEKVEEGPISYPHSGVSLKKPTNDETWRSISVSTFAQINTSEVMAERLTRLRSIFTKRSAAGLSQEKNQHLSLPDTNAATFAFSKPEYIENSDGSLRGVFYFAVRGQDDGGGLSLIAVVTDNSNKVFELSISGYPSSKFTSDFEKRVKDAGNDQGKITQIFQEFYAYVKTISSSTTSEPIVAEFKSTYKPLIGTFKSL